jgi:hypothetical protein
MPRVSDITPAVAILSTATRDAIDALGTLENSTAVVTVGQTQLWRCQSATDGDTLSLRDAQALDRAGAGRGGPFILRAYAQLLNHIAIPLPDVRADHPGEITDKLIEMVGEFGDLSRTVTAAEADEEWRRREAQRALDDLDEIFRLGGEMRALLMAIAHPAVTAPATVTA